MTWDEQIAKVLEIVKKRLSLEDNALDDLLTTYIEEIGQRIKHYCNIYRIPDELTHVWASMTVDAVRVDQPSIDEIAKTVGGGKSVKIGDTSVSDVVGGGSGLSNTAKSAIDGIVFDYRTDLRRYRRMRW